MQQTNLPETRASLILRLRNKEDVEAWHDFVAIYAPVIVRVARRRGFQTADSENLVQEVLLSISLALPQWLQKEHRGSFRAWLLTIARNEAVDMLTRRTTRPIGHDGEAAERLLAELPDLRDNLSRQFDFEYEKAIFQWAAFRIRDSVSNTAWQSFWLTHVENQSVTSAAHQLNMRPGSVYVARGRVMKRIRELIQKFEELK